MQLSEFITESLNQIFTGIADAKKTAAERGFQVNPWITIGNSDTSGKLVDRETKTPVQLVEFDVAITTAESEECKGGAGILIASFGLGGQLKSDATSSVVSRLKFSVPIAFPPA